MFSALPKRAGRADRPVHGRSAPALPHRCARRGRLRTDIFPHPAGPAPYVAAELVAGLGVVCVVAALALGMFVRARRQLALIERERAASEQELRVAQARQMERNRIAREMHNVLAHRLSLLSLQAGALELGPDAPPAEVARTAGVIRINAHGALEDLREVIGVLPSASVDDNSADGVPERPQPTLADLPMLIDESRKAGMQVALECEVTDLRAVPEAMGRTAYRIVQEGLTNARKHAGCGRGYRGRRDRFGPGHDRRRRSRGTGGASDDPRPRTGR
jgi:signal transduction histidine kinase